MVKHVSIENLRFLTVIIVFFFIFHTDLEGVTDMAN